MRLLIVLIIFVFNSTALAENLDREAINDALINIKAIPLKHKGQEGIWFPKADSELLLKLVTNKLDLALDTIDNQTIQINALKDAVKSYKESNTSYAELADYNRKMFDVAMKHLPNLDPPPDMAWYKTPEATFIYGLVLGVGVTVGATCLAIEAVKTSNQ
ncbi:hypothetical protein KAR91_04895 [Candidatus Pacearchaeota archaeon]|nr:hypothetical protein [Candidatus Pacearchaeota archaeon]